MNLEVGMKRKPLEKLSKRLERLFLTHVKEYDTRYFDDPICDTEWNWERVPPIWFAGKMQDYVMAMIAEYVPEDIE
jgi:hypothetical protein